MPSARSLQSYLDAIGKAGDLEPTTWDPQDAQLRADLHQQVFMNLVQGYFVYQCSDGNSPDFTPMYNNVLLLQPNPDDTYVRTNVDGGGVYRLSGERGSVRLLTITMGQQNIGMTETPGGQTAEYDLDEHLSFDADGRFEVLLSDEKPSGYEGQWLRMPKDSDAIIVRRRSYDWAEERDPRLAIERIDISPLRERPSQAQVEERLMALAEYAERHSRQWLRYQDQIRDKGIINRIEHHSFSALGGIKVQQYWWGLFELEPGEALILETEIPETAPYWNIQLNDQLWNTLEYVWRQSHLNGHQARLDSDGKFRAVISVEDPGVPNWLDTVGRLQGTMVGRWYKCSSHPVPSLRKVRLSEVRDYLPADTPVISREEREASIRDRARAYQMRIRW
jgi:hypothetical protein